jgi:aspartyl-tRNA(Asn)/glutamyl-tRNA(Gln) amidotransferase subunit A
VPSFAAGEIAADDYTNEARYHRRMQLPATIAQASRLIAARELSPVELTQAALARIDAWNGAIHAFNTVVAARALAQAQAAEQEIAHGCHRGPLHGIPFAAKDNYETAGILTSGYSRAFLDHVPAADASAVARLHAAGAILIGKLAMHELANGGPSFDLPWPPARNPWSLEHATGGSSTGAGAAVAAGLVPLALGSDTGGSIRIPAGMCGVVGLKPTYGLVSCAGVIPHSASLDHCGPLTATVADCAAALQALAGHDPRDGAGVPAPACDYGAALTGDIRGLRIGVVRDWWEAPAAQSGDANARAADAHGTEALARAMEPALQVLAELGARMETVRLASLQRSYDVKNVIAKAEVFAVHHARLRSRIDAFGTDFLALTLPGCLFPATDYLAAKAAQRALTREMLDVFGTYDVLVTAGSGPAPLLAAASANRPVDHWTRPNPETPFSVTGVPAMTVCAGFTAGGLPLAMQIAGRPFDEGTVLRVGHACERAAGWHERRPPLAPLPRAQAGREETQDGAAASALPEAPPAAMEIRRLVADRVRQAGIPLRDAHRGLLERLAPVALAAAHRVRGAHG